MCSVRPCAPRGRTRLVLPHSPGMSQQVSSAKGTRLLRGPPPPAQALGLLLRSVWDRHPEKGVAGTENGEPGRALGGGCGSQGPWGRNGLHPQTAVPSPWPCPCLTSCFLSPTSAPCALPPLRAWLVGADADETGPWLGSGPRAAAGPSGRLPGAAPRSKGRAGEALGPGNSQQGHGAARVSWRLLGDSQWL